MECEGCRSGRTGSFSTGSGKVAEGRVSHSYPPNLRMLQNGRGEVEVGKIRPIGFARLADGPGERLREQRPKNGLLKPLVKASAGH